MRTVKILIRLGGCPGWSESLLGTHAILLVLSCRGSFQWCLVQNEAHNIFWKNLSATEIWTQDPMMKRNADCLVMWTHNRKNNIVVVVCSCLTSLSTIFQTYHDVVWLRHGAHYAHFYSAASLKYHAPDTWHDATPSHIILTLGLPVLALPFKTWVPSEERLVPLLTTLVWRGPESKPVTSHSLEQTLYLLSYPGQ